MITMQALTGDELMAFVDGDIYKSLPDVPISLQRAKSQYHNPRRRPDDILLLLAFEGEDLLGYLGAVPDLLHDGRQDAIHMAWLSCIWVGKQARGKGVALKMIKQMAEYWDQRLVLTEYVPAIKVLYDRSGIFDKEPIALIGVRRFYRACSATVLPSRSANLAPLSPLLRIVDKLTNMVVDLRHIWTSPPKIDLDIAVSKTLDTEQQAFIDEHSKTGLFGRGGLEIEWAVLHPWLREGQADEVEARYYFTAAVGRREVSILSFREYGEIIGLAITSIRDDHMRVPLFYSNKHTSEIALYLDYWAVEQRIDRLTVYHQDLCATMRRNSHSAIYQRDTTRSYLASTELPSVEWTDYNIQDGDGDAFFT